MAAILAEREAAHAAKLYNEALSLGADIEAARKELDTVRARLSFFSGERQSLGFVRLVAAALPPETAYGVGRKKLLLAALLAAILVAALVPMAIDMVDGRVRAVGDAERAMNMPALGWHVQGDGEAARLFADDQLRRMAGALTRERDRHGTQVFALSGVKPGAGTSGLVVKLGHTLDSLGYPTLVVEANAFSPDARYGSARPGLAECLREEAAAEECIEPARGELPARVRVGAAVGHLGRGGGRSGFEFHLSKYSVLAVVEARFTDTPFDCAQGGDVYGIIVGGGAVRVGVSVGLGVSVGVGERVAVLVGRGVRVGRGVSVGVKVRVGVSEGGRTRVGVISASTGYSSRMAAYQSNPPDKTNSVKREPR